MSNALGPMSGVALFKAVLLAGIGYGAVRALLTKLKRAGTQPPEIRDRLVRIWKWQAVGLGLAGVSLAAMWIEMGMDDAPFWSLYAVIGGGGGGILIYIHNRIREQAVSKPVRSPVNSHHDRTARRHPERFDDPSSDPQSITAYSPLSMILVILAAIAMFSGLIVTIYPHLARYSGPLYYLAGGLGFVGGVLFVISGNKRSS